MGDNCAWEQCHQDLIQLHEIQLGFCFPLVSRLFLPQELHSFNLAAPSHRSKREGGSLQGSHTKLKMAFGHAPPLLSWACILCWWSHWLCLTSLVGAWGRDELVMLSLWYLEEWDPWPLSHKIILDTLGVFNYSVPTLSPENECAKKATWAGPPCLCCDCSTRVVSRTCVLSKSRWLSQTLQHAQWAAPTSPPQKPVICKTIWPPHGSGFIWWCEDGRCCCFLPKGPPSTSFAIPQYLAELSFIQIVARYCSGEAGPPSMCLAGKPFGSFSSTWRAIQNKQ